jgi:hypothetical protein
MRKARHTTAILAAGLLAGFLPTCGLVSAHTTPTECPRCQAGGQEDVGGLQDPAFAETRRLYRLPVLL